MSKLGEAPLSDWALPNFFNPSASSPSVPELSPTIITTTTTATTPATTTTTTTTTTATATATTTTTTYT